MKTELSSEKVSVVCVGDDGGERSQTSAIRLDGRKGENVRDSTIQRVLDTATTDWCRNRDPHALRSVLLSLLPGWETKLAESLPSELKDSLPSIEDLEAELARGGE